MLEAAVPLQFRRQLMTVYYTNKLAGHRGHEQTATLIAKTYWWPGMAPDIRSFTQACIWCSVAKTRKVGKGLMIGWGLEPRKLQCVHADYYGPLRQTAKGNKYVFGAIDRFTSWCIMVPTKDCMAQTAAQSYTNTGSVFSDALQW